MVHRAGRIAPTPHLPHLLGLPAGWPYVRFADRPGYGGHWKLGGIDAFAGPDRPLAWIDDHHDAACRAWAVARPGPTLLVTTEPDLGLTRRTSRACASGLTHWIHESPARRRTRPARGRLWERRDARLGADGTLKYTRSGGIAGVSVGTTIKADGNATFDDRRNGQRKAKLTKAERDRLTRLVRAADLAHVKADGKSDAAISSSTR